MAFAILGAGLLLLCHLDLPETNGLVGRRTATLKQYFGLLRNSLFWAHVGCLMFSLGSFYAFVAGVPLVGERQFDLSASQIGLGLGSISGGFMMGNVIVGRMSGRVAAKTLVMAGRLAALVGPFVGIVCFSLGVVHPYSLFLPVLLVGFGNGLTLPGVNAAVMYVDPDLAGSASGLASTMTLVAGAATTTLAGVVVSGDGGAMGLLVLMLVISALAYGSAFLAFRLEARRP